MFKAVKAYGLNWVKHQGSMSNVKVYRVRCLRSGRMLGGPRGYSRFEVQDMRVEAVRLGSSGRVEDQDFRIF